MFCKNILLLLTVAGSALAAPALKVINEGAPGTIPDKYIIVFKDGTTDAAVNTHTDRISKFHEKRGMDVKEKTKKAGIRKKFNFKSEKGFKGYSGDFDKATVKEILKSPEVAFVEQDAVVKLNDKVDLEKRVYRPSAIWSLDRISHEKYTAPFAYYYDDKYAGDGVTVYVIDTGIRTTHKEFIDLGTGRSRASFGFNAVGDGINTDGNGHGTHCAGTIGGNTYGVNRKVKLVAVKVLDSQGSGTWSGVLNGMNWVAANARPNYSVASMSLGGGKSASVNAAVDTLWNSGVILAVAAGNEGADAINSSPASAPRAITVGAIDSSNQVASWSNYGNTVDILAPGVSIQSTWISSDTSTAFLSGTSMATPHVAGVAAYYISKMAATGGSPNPTKITSLLIDNATKDQIGGNLRDAPNRILSNDYCAKGYQCLY
uniref:Cuticle-degrading serine protease n=1 Tax=Dactylellina haptotyla TaxID=430498 RepID=B1NNU1_9PEZI|nr:serine protease [Dactylellina haptotyla]